MNNRCRDISPFSCIIVGGETVVAYCPYDGKRPHQNASDLLTSLSFTLCSFACVTQRAEIKTVVMLSAVAIRSVYSDMT